MISKKVKEQIKVEQKLIKDFVDTFKLEQENEGDIIKDKNQKEYTYEGIGLNDFSSAKIDEKELLENGILEHIIQYNDGKYRYNIYLTPQRNLETSKWVKIKY